MAGISLILYFMGFTPIINILQSTTPIDSKLYKTTTTDGVTTIKAEDTLLDKNYTIGAIVFIAVGAGVASAFLTGFAITYIFPMIIFMVVLNLFILPINFLVDPNIIPALIAYPILFIYNIITVLTLVTFIRSGS
jgi:hypothetical protein